MFGKVMSDVKIDYLSLSLSNQWVCQFCTYLNYSPATVCEMCDLARPEPAPLPTKLHPPSPVRRVPALPIKPKEPVTEDLDTQRQRLMKEEGLKLIHLIRASDLDHLFLLWGLHTACVFKCLCPLYVCQDGEKRGLSPEEVYTSRRVAGDSGILPCKWLRTDLPILLDQILILVATSSYQSFPTKDAVSMLVSVPICLILISFILYVSLNVTSCSVFR